MKELFFYIIAIAIGWFACLHFVVPTEPEQIVEQRPEIGLGKTFIVATNTVTWVTDPAKIVEAFANANKTNPSPQGYTRTGLAVYDIEKCTVYAYEPTGAADKERLYVLGHELMHCFRGDYHK